MVLEMSHSLAKKAQDKNYILFYIHNHYKYVFLKYH